MDASEAIEVALNSTAEGQDRLAAAHRIALAMDVGEIESARSAAAEAAGVADYESAYALGQADETLALASEFHRRGRVAAVSNHGSNEQLAAYMPGNYTVIDRGADMAPFVVGIDRAGWTLDGYVIPRLASGLIWAEEIDRTSAV